MSDPIRMKIQTTILIFERLPCQLNVGPINFSLIVTRNYDEMEVAMSKHYEGESTVFVSKGVKLIISI